MNIKEQKPLHRTPKFSEIESYRYLGRAEVAAMLEGLGFGESKRMLHAAYFSPDGSHIVGVLDFDESMCEGHMVDDPIFQGVLGPEAMAQTWIVLKIFKGELTPDKTARFEGLDRIRFRHSLYPPVVVNIVVSEMPERNAAYGQILVGKLATSQGQPAIEGLFHASILDKERTRDNGERRKRIQENSHILFPLQD